MSDIQSSIKTVRDLLKESYRLGAYQRDYEWETTHVVAFLKDLQTAFYPRAGAVGGKGCFLGSILVMSANGEALLIDGQQRLTTLLLLISTLRRQLKETPQPLGLALRQLFQPKLKDGPLKEIFRDPDRNRALAELDQFGEIRSGASSETERNMSARFKEIEAFVLDHIDPSELHAFAAWLLDKVSFAEVRAGPSHDSFALFDAMNSRGMPLKALDQFTSFIGRRIAVPEVRATALDRWREVRSTIGRNGAGAESDFVKSWLGARCLDMTGPVPARAIDARKALARSVMSEIERDGPFWALRNTDRHNELGLKEPLRFVEDHAEIYGEVFDRVRRAREVYDPDLPSMFFLQRTKFDLDLYDEVFLLACAKPASEAWLPRVQLGALFLEIVAARYAWTAGARLAKRNTDRLKALLAHMVSAVRDVPTDRLALVLENRLSEVGFDFDDNKDPKKVGASHAHALLARMTAYLDELQGERGAYGKYEVRTGPGAFEVEHLLTVTYRQRGAQSGHGFASPDVYRAQRQRFGALVLIPAEFNRELSSKSYTEKRSAYAGNNLNYLVNTLFGTANLPQRLRQELHERQIHFPDAPILDKAALDARQRGYLALAKQTWSPTRLRELAARTTPQLAMTA